MFKEIKRKISGFLMLSLIFQIVAAFGFSNPTFAANSGDVKINEVAWAGTPDNSRDEWIELYNPTANAIDLSGWSISDDGANPLIIDSGIIGARGYFLIEDSEDVVSNLNADAVISMSLANAGETLTLSDADGNEIDVVNPEGGAWPAGDSDSAATMELIDPNLEYSDENWANALNGNGSIGSAGNNILGTPRGPNSNSRLTDTTISIERELEALGNVGDATLTYHFSIEAAENLVGYGFEINYNPEELLFVDAEDGGFLGEEGESAFFASLENGEAGKVIIGNAKLANPQEGINGNGQLFSISLEVLNGVDVDRDDLITIGPESFMTDINGDIAINLAGSIGDPDGDSGENPGDGVIQTVENLTINEGESRYSLELNWQYPEAENQSFQIERLNPNGEFELIGETEELSFIDGVDSGAGILIGVEHSYRIYTIVEGSRSEFVEIRGVDNRGLIGDLNRSDRVDGRDLVFLAASYGNSWEEEGYVQSKDTNYDGIIDGADLISIGANFGRRF